MSCTRKEFVAQMQSWVGLKESNGSHKKIIDIYNTIKPLPRGYKLRYTDEWCAGTVSAAAKACNALDIIPAECSCSRMIELAKAMGIWIEADDYVPAPGDIMLFDWDDTGKGDNKNSPDHIGVVVKVSGKYIRGYIVPKFNAEPVVVDKPVARELISVQVESLKKGSKGSAVKAMQILLAGNDCKCGSYGADGDFGSATDSALRKYQKKKNLQVDGICGSDTWAALLGMK